MYDYYADRYGIECLKLAELCKSDVGFGALLVKNGRILGRGRNRLATQQERNQMSHVDYAIHAEQAAILDALSRHKSISGSTVYVLGLARAGKNKGTLTTRQEKVFVCHKCPHALKRFNLSVHIPHVSGWSELSSDEAMKIGQKLKNSGYWKDFVARV